jgi:biopolymer transport protein ExbD
MARKKKTANAKFMKKEVEEVDAILPFMSLLLIIIPVLISNVAFFHFKAIAISAPGVSDNSSSPDEPQENPNKEKNVMAQLRIEPGKVQLEVIDESNGETIKKVTEGLSEAGGKKIWGELQGFKREYPKLNSLLIRSHRKIEYEKVVTVFDELKQPFAISNENPEKQFKFNIVILPMIEEESLAEES